MSHEQAQKERNTEAREEHGTQAEEPKSRERRPRWMPSLTIIGYGLAGLVLVGYFGWLCAEMAGHAISGGAAIAAIFGASAIGVLVAGVGMQVGRSGREH